MTPMNVLPPVPAVWGDGLGGGVAAAAGDQRAVGADLAARVDRTAPTGTTGRCGSAGRPRATSGSGCPTMIVAGWADGYRNNTFRTVAAARGRHGTPHRLLAGPWAHADPTTAMPGPRIDFDAELAGWFDHWLRGTGTHEDGCDVFVRASTRPELDLDLHEGYWLRLPSVPPTSPTVDRRPRPAPRDAAVDRRRRHRRVDRLRRPPAVGAVRRPAARRRAVADLGRRPAARRRSSGTPSPGSAVSAIGACGVALGQALRRLPRRHLGPGLPRLPRPGLPRRRSTGRPSRSCPARSYDVEVVLDACAYAVVARPDAARQRRRRRLAQHDRAAGPGDAHRALGRGRAAGARRARGRRPTFGPGAEHSSESAEGVAWEIHDDVLRPHHDGAHGVGLGVRHAVRRPRAGGLPRRGQRRPPHVRPARPRRHDATSCRGRASTIRVRSVMDVVVEGGRGGRDDPHRRGARRCGRQRADLVS